MSHNAVIVGMPRSGTSLTANVFAAQGYCVRHTEGSTVREADDYNPFGYFESDQLIENNVEILRRAGYDCHNSWLFDPISPEAVERIFHMSPLEHHREFVRAHEPCTPWLWKDPRLCYTLPYWWKLLDPTTTRVVLVRRDAADIYKSFRRRGWCPADEAARADVMQRATDHLTAAERAVYALGIPHLVVEYADYLLQPAKTADRLGRFFGLELATSDLNVHPSLDHSAARGWLPGQLRILLRALPRAPVKALERWIPRKVVAQVFPERRHEHRNTR